MPTAPDDSLVLSRIGGEILYKSPSIVPCRYELVHNELIRLVQNSGTFWRIFYNSDGSAYTSLAYPVIPVGVNANEVYTGYELGRSRRTLTRDREEWRWAIIVEFACPTTGEEVENNLARYPKLIFPSNGDGRKDTMLVELLNVSYDHPVRVQSSSGTKMTFLVNIKTTPH